MQSGTDLWKRAVEEAVSYSLPKLSAEHPVMPWQTPAPHPSYLATGVVGRNE